MRKSALFAILSGLLFWASFSPIEFWPCAFVGASILFFALVGKNIGERLAIAALSGLAFFLPLLHWSGSYVGSFPWIALSLLQTLLFAAISIIRVGRDFSSVVRFASIFTLTEIIRMKLPFGGFGWGRIGFSQVDALHSIYPYVGIVGITFFVIFIGALAIFRLKYAIVVGVSTILIASIAPSHNGFTSRISIDAVQGGVDQLGLDFNSRALSVLIRHAKVTEEISNPAELIIWPENSSDLDPIRDPNAKRILKEALSKIGRPILIGAVEDGRAGPLNTSLLFSQDGALLSRYIKQDLTPFGEYMPLRTLAESITPAAGRVVNFVPGTKWVRHQINGITFTSIICFELLDDDHIRSGLMDSQFAVAQTNNATFGKSPQASQQLQITRARAAELGRQFAVVSTTGWTAQIDNNGNVVSRLERFKPGYLRMEIEGRSVRTPASRLSTTHWCVLLAIPLSVLRRRSI